MKKNSNTISLQEFKKRFSASELEAIKEEVAYYDLLTSFKETREKLGMTQEELADRANINRTTLSKIESGIRNATIGTLMKLAQAMGHRLEIKFS